MRKVIAMANVPLDGTVRAPGHPDQDTRGGFAHGGRALPHGIFSHTAPQRAANWTPPGSASRVRPARATWPTWHTDWATAAFATRAMRRWKGCIRDGGA